MSDLDRSEADRCPHCGRILVDPPNCCEQAKAEHAAWEKYRLLRDKHDAAEMDRQDEQQSYGYLEWAGHEHAGYESD